MRIQSIIPCSLLILASFNCAGPNYYFDKGPAPEWTREVNSKIAKRAIRMIGTAPVTSQTQRDSELAIRDAKARIGQLFVSEVKAKTSDWTLNLSGGDHDGHRQVTQQNVQVRTQMKVEDVKVEATYRDEDTRTQYVAVTVNRIAWSNKIQKRINQNLQKLEGKLQKAEKSRAARQGLTAYTQLQEGYHLGASTEADIIVIDLLNPKLGLGKKLADLKTKLNEVNKALRQSFSFQLQVQTSNQNVGAAFNSKLEEFLNGYGFSLGQAKTENVIMIHAELNQKFLTQEKVGNRIEYVHAAIGKLRVTDADGSEVHSLSISLPERGYTERETNKKDAAARALQLSSDSLSSKFRSQFRKTFQTTTD
ncbi:MAG: hypothetical protein VYA34_08350 [Myxococcota bacterium]|nr:hypothetical protein [Myxococcota bacterium]